MDADPRTRPNKLEHANAVVVVFVVVVGAAATGVSFGAAAANGR